MRNGDDGTSSCAAISAARWPSSNAQTESAVFTCTVPSRAMRAATRCARSRRRPPRGQRSSELGHAGLRPEPAELGADRQVQAVPGSTSTSCAGSTGSAERCVVVIIVCPIPATRVASTSLRCGSSSERTSSSRRSGGAGNSSRLCEQQREHGEALLALRPELTQVTRAARDEHVVEVWAEARGPALDVAGEPRVQPHASVARPRSRAARPASPARSARSAKGGAGVSSAARRCSTSTAPSSATRSVHGSSALAVGERRAARGAARRSAGRARRGSPAAAEARAGNKRPSTRSK